MYVLYPCGWGLTNETAVPTATGVGPCEFLGVSEHGGDGNRF